LVMWMENSCVSIVCQCLYTQQCFRFQSLQDMCFSGSYRQFGIVGKSAVLEASSTWPPAVTTLRLDGPVSFIPCADCINVHDAPESNNASLIAAFMAISLSCLCRRRAFLCSRWHAHRLDTLEIGRGVSLMQQSTS
jgi:hypothetical protein